MGVGWDCIPVLHPAVCLDRLSYYRPARGPWRLWALVRMKAVQKVR